MTPRHERAWTTAEDAVLKALIPLIQSGATTYDLAAGKLGRTKNSFVGRAARLCLRPKIGPTIGTFEERRLAHLARQTRSRKREAALERRLAALDLPYAPAPERQHRAWLEAQCA